MDDTIRQIIGLDGIMPGLTPYLDYQVLGLNRYFDQLKFSDWGRIIDKVK